MAMVKPVPAQTPCSTNALPSLPWGVNAALPLPLPLPLSMRDAQPPHMDAMVSFIRTVDVRSFNLCVLNPHLSYDQCVRMVVIYTQRELESACPPTLRRQAAWFAEAKALASVNKDVGVCVLQGAMDYEAPSYCHEEARYF
jgi:hypothetical protein